MADLLTDGFIRVTWCLTIADISAPTVAELDAGVDLSDVITKDGLDIKPDTASVDNTALSSTDETEEPGMNKYDIQITAKLKDNPSEDVAWNTLTDKALGYLCVRRRVPIGTAYADGQDIEVYPGRCGRPGMLAPEKNSPQKFQVKIFNNVAPDTRAVVAA